MVSESDHDFSTPDEAGMKIILAKVKIAYEYRLNL